MEQYKIIIAGGRDFSDRTLMAQSMNSLWNAHWSDKAISIVSGMARGADMLGRSLALESGIPVHEFPANWDEYGKRAGFIRNEQMGDFADALVAFWDGTSRGTAQMIQYMQQLGKPTYVVRY